MNARGFTVNACVILTDKKWGKQEVEKKDLETGKSCIF